jgi:hypothetical protein
MVRRYNYHNLIRLIRYFHWFAIIFCLLIVLFWVSIEFIHFQNKSWFLFGKVFILFLFHMILVILSGWSFYYCSTRSLKLTYVEIDECGIRFCNRTKNIFFTWGSVKSLYIKWGSAIVKTDSGKIRIDYFMQPTDVPLIKLSTKVDFKSLVRNKILLEEIKRQVPHAKITHAWPYCWLRKWFQKGGRSNQEIYENRWT